MVLYLPNSNTGDRDLQFSGKLEKAKDDLDAVLIFDGSSFRLELLGSQVNARWVRVDAGA